MQKHTRIYYNYFDLGEEDFVACEICGCKAVDINHIDCRGMGGSKTKDYIENLMASCRSCHEYYGDKKQFIDFLKETHFRFMKNHKK